MLITLPVATQLLRESELTKKESCPSRAHSLVGQVEERNTEAQIAVCWGGAR